MLFKEVKKLFIKELVLRIYKLSLLIKVKIDVLDFTLGVYLITLVIDIIVQFHWCYLLTIIYD